MIAQSEFLIKYGIGKETFVSTGLSWEELIGIHENYLNFKVELEASATFIFNMLMKCEKVHSVRYRIKNPEHLIEKIIRKKVENQSWDITIANYKDEVTDLIGIRALHLFKEDWEIIHDFICKTWNQKGKPVANFRKGDAEEIINFYKKKDCETNEHQFGYRSVHYLLETQPTSIKHIVEIQVRTIFEEAWAEIDHTVRYPYNLDNEVFYRFLLILNRLAGSADEMGSFIIMLQNDLSLREKELNEKTEENQRLLDDLEDKIEKSHLQGKELEAVKADLQKLKDKAADKFPLVDEYIRKGTALGGFSTGLLGGLLPRTPISDLIKNVPKQTLKEIIDDMEKDRPKIITRDERQSQ